MNWEYWQSRCESLEFENERYKKALGHAVDMIERYQTALRNAKISDWQVKSKSDIDHSLTFEDIGFCQGPIYIKALKKIENLRTGETWRV